MNAELVSSELDSEASWSRPSLAEASNALLGGWWDDPLGRVAVGEGARTRDAAARAFGSVPGSVRRAREFAARTLEEWGLEDVVEDVRLIISELVGNACRHARPGSGRPEDGRVVVQLRHLADQGGVVCMVADSSRKAPVRVDAHHFAESGRGLGLVSAFSREWGWEPVEGRGKIVWAICDSEG
ncbi:MULTISPECIES: ATP-binding protein [Nocardiopsis]|uniref:Anti-sigma regulatory factor (Ser/Thr protein kinase) n=1 Tax=Nocardiopsis sinuspersici TaxID=501010 RepID=A0A1V3C9C8_9ACTN|nr:MULTISPECIES: ATP-binding protein [Nocardiopsis]NYH52121.1 anti-sigma regulatory factor (Ser/Thr protein kinase) [Nocardiopsis sinuspersici]OOC57303.1 histidine kinase [Nocardiopsis sinuspersici]